MTMPRKKLTEAVLPPPEINDASAFDTMPGIGPQPKAPVITKKMVDDAEEQMLKEEAEYHAKFMRSDSATIRRRRPGRN